MSISEISLYKALRSKLGDDAASELVEYVKNEAKSEIQSRTDTFLTKSDKVELMEKMSDDKSELLERISDNRTQLLEKINGTRTELTKEINDTKTELTKEMNDIKSELLEKMNKDKIDLLKWMFGFWITIILLFIAHWYL